MWVRKSEAEIAKLIDDKKIESRSIKKPLIFSLSMFTLSSLLYAWGYRGGLSSGMIIYSTNHDFLPNLIRILPFSVLLAVIVFLVSYIKRIRAKGFSKDVKALLCNQCFEPQHGYLFSFCRCGGRLEPFEFFTYTDKTK